MPVRSSALLSSLPLSQRGESLARQVADALRDAIVRDRLVPGTALPTARELCNHFGVSRPVVREAMAVLVHEGLAVTRQGSGAFVASPADARPVPGSPPDPTLDLVDIRRAIEVEAAALAALRRDAADLTRIREALRTLDRRNDADLEAVDEGFAFHRSLALASHNARLVTILDQLQPHLVGTMRVMRGNRARHGEFTRAVKREHHAIVDAIAAGDPARAREAALRHFDASEARIRVTDKAVWAAAAPDDRPPDGRANDSPKPRGRSATPVRNAAPVTRTTARRDR